MQIVYKLDQPGSVDGWGPNVNVGYFLDPGDAQTVGASGYLNRAMGGPAPTITKIVVYDNLDEFAMNNPEYKGPGSDKRGRLREAALKKLSSEDRALLGLE